MQMAVSVHSDIITGQFVCIEQTPASVGERIVGRIIDYVALIVYLIGVSVLITETDIGNSISKYPLFILFVFLPVAFYSAICEIFFGGRSLGKYLTGTRVVMADGSQPGLGASLLRWILIPIDIYFSFLGLIFILFSKRHQRLGDMAAGTIVIRQPNMKRMHLSLSEFDYARRDYHPVYPEAQKLSFGQAEIIKKALDNVHRHGTQHVDALSKKTTRMLGIKPKESDNVKYLQTLFHDYQFYATEII